MKALKTDLIRRLGRRVQFIAACLTNSDLGLGEYGQDYCQISEAKPVVVGRRAQERKALWRNVEKRRNLKKCWYLDKVEVKQI
jgi:hypothetical protein